MLPPDLQIPTPTLVPKVWVFAGFNPVDKHELAILKDIGATGVIFGLDDEDDDRNGVDRRDYADKWKPRYSRKRLLKSLKMCQDAGLEIGTHHWARPADPWDELAYEFMFKLTEDIELDWCVFDAERHWLKMKPENGLTAQEWVDDVWAPRWAGVSVARQYAVAAYAYPTARMLPLALHDCVDAVIPMAYAPKRMGGTPPPQLQIESIKRWSKVLNGDGEGVQYAGAHPKLWMGLGAYDQRWPGRTETEVMTESAVACIELGCTRLIWWQLETIDKNGPLNRGRRAVLKAAARGFAPQGVA